MYSVILAYVSVSEYSVQKMQSCDIKAFSSVKFYFFLSHGNCFEHLYFSTLKVHKYLFCIVVMLKIKWNVYSS